MINKKIKKNLWKELTNFIKQRDGRKCFTCGKKIEPGKGLHCGHFIPSKICGYELRYDEKNVHVQCYFCNINLGGSGAIYYHNMLKKYGQNEINKLFAKYKKHKKNKTPWSEEDYLNKIKYYQSKL